jgi:ornithine cyclodeaminase/alanine dehydrogenase-like protein (mu-crystallin family)
MDTLLLSRGDVTSLLSIAECMDAVENVFCLYGEGKAIAPKVLGMHCNDGGFHIKTGILGSESSYFVAKVNANFPANPRQNGLPTIQGVIVVCDARNGRLLALMDTMELTVIRTGAATGVAAKYLSDPHAEVVTICGCGNQGRISLDALKMVRPVKKIFAFDIDKDRSEEFRIKQGKDLEVVAIGNGDLSAALLQSDIVIACTPSTNPYIRASDIVPGTFIAAVGADNEYKSELFPELFPLAKVVTDITAQCAVMGDLHHAIEKNFMSADAVYAQLGEIIAGKKPGRISPEEIVIFDSTGTALQDVAAAAIVYEKAISKGMGHLMDFFQQQSMKEPVDRSTSKTEVKALRSWFPFR